MSRYNIRYIHKVAFIKKSSALTRLKKLYQNTLHMLQEFTEEKKHKFSTLLQFTNLLSCAI